MSWLTALGLCIAGLAAIIIEFFDRPDKVGRAAILRVHVRKVQLDPNLDIEAIAALTTGFSGADLSNLVNEAAILAARRDKKAIGLTELEESIDRVIAGPERRSRVILEGDVPSPANPPVSSSGVALSRRLPSGSMPQAWRACRAKIWAAIPDFWSEVPRPNTLPSFSSAPKGSTLQAGPAGTTS